MIRRSLVRRYAGWAGAAVGAVSAGAAAGVMAERTLVSPRRKPSEQPFGSLRGHQRTVRADDGVEIYAEVDDMRPPRAGATTLVFVHGYALNLDSWHFQRAALRHEHRLVLYDQRSHGRSGRSPSDHCTIDQLGRDLASVIDQLGGDGPVVLAGHSMGGMTIMALAEQRPDWFGQRIAAVALVATSAGGLGDEILGLPRLPGRLLHRVTPAVVATLARAPRLVDHGRRAGSDIGFMVTRRLAFGGPVPAAYVDFTDEMLAATPFEVVADFFTGVDLHDKREALAALASTPVVVVCGTDDSITPVRHTQEMAASLPVAEMVTLEGAGHMVILERHAEVTAAISRLASSAGSAPAGLNDVSLEVPDAAAAHDLGRRLARVLRAGDVVILSGELGAGKTTLVQGIGAGLEVRGDITSPTFVISRVHPPLGGGPALVHVDAYRLAAAVELDDLDLDTTAEAAVTVVEWGEGLAETLAVDRLHVRIDRARGGDGDLAEMRLVTVSPVGARWVGSRLAACLQSSSGSRSTPEVRESGP